MISYVKLAKKLGIKRIRLKFGQNQIVKRLFRTVKHRTHWLNKFSSLKNARNFFSFWIIHYNFVRFHRGIKKTPCEMLGMKKLSCIGLIMNIFFLFFCIGF